MKTAGIIAEYNPFHNGHQYHIEETRRRTGADHIVAVMSGDFVQRGAPALLSKYDRARMALLSGADLVFELPVTAALQSAEGFATGSVSLLANLGVIDTVSCGCEETVDDTLFSEVVNLLCEEPPAFREALNTALRKGQSFPAAREEAVAACLGRSPGTLLSEPNQILSLEYARAIQKAGAPMELCRIPRREAAHHDDQIHASYASATAIRDRLLAKKNEDPALCGVIPKGAYEILAQAHADGACLTANDFSELLGYALTEHREELDAFAPAGDDLARRAARLAEQYTGWSDFAALLKTKNRTYTAVSRYLTRVLLNIRQTDLARTSRYACAPYARLLGMRRKAAPLLAEIRARAVIPVLTQPGAEAETLDPDRRSLFDLDVRSAEIYRQILRAHTGRETLPERRTPLIVLP